MVSETLRLGDVFEVASETGDHYYFQWIAIDENQLRSDVIRVFAARPPINDLQELDSGDVMFYAHCVIKVGIRLGYWKKRGNLAYPSEVDVVFRSSCDFGRKEIEISERWDVWRLNEPRVFVGKLPTELCSAEPGEVFPPAEIIFRMQNGRYEQPYQA
jgi:hypothetical protein